MNQLNELNKPDPRFHGGKLREIFTSFLFYLSILFFFIGFNFSDTMLGGWTQQFMPNLGGRQITDITFLDSLIGYATARITSDTNYVLKSTNGGDNWTIILREYSYLNRVQFLNQNTGYICGAFLKKTTNAGENWSNVNVSGIVAENMHVLNEDTIWIIDADPLEGGVFRTTDGGASWEPQAAFGSQNPNHIYMFNGRLGFICKDNVYLRRTTNSGLNWDTISGAGGFLDMYFADSLTGWKTSMQKTTNGGLNWVNQVLPQGGNILISEIKSFSNVNRDTIWGVGGTVFYGAGQFRGMVYRTINAGNNWLFQVPDTTIHLGTYYYTTFINKNIGWAYATFPSGIHTTSGGDTGFITSIKQISSNIPDKFYLRQNYPNPFNPATIIKFQIQRLADLKIAVYDITGKELTTLADKEYKAGTYEVTFDGTGYSSGIYFYSLIVDGKLIDTKRMVLIK